MQVNELSNGELISGIKKLKGEENKILADVVLHLNEIDKRGIFRDEGYSSLFTYCTEALGYSNASAYRRIQAARALNDNPKIYEHIKEGRLTLCAISEIFKVTKVQDKEVLIESSIGQSKAVVQSLALQYQEASKPRKIERIKAKKVLVEAAIMPLIDSCGEKTITTLQPKEEIRFSVNIEVDEETMKLINEAKVHTGNIQLAKLLKKTLKEFVNKRSKKVIRRPNTISTKPIKRSRYIPREARQQVRERDNHQCAYKTESGHRCSETNGLQFDHILPFALGGKTEESNLRLLCPAHNQLCAESILGKDKIESYFRGGSNAGTKFENSSRNGRVGFIRP